MALDVTAITPTCADRRAVRALLMRVAMKSCWLTAPFFLFACSGSDNSDLTRSGDATNPSSSSGSSGSSSSSSSSTVSSQAEQVNGGCPSNPQKLKGTKSSGSPCSTYADCKPTCCDCSSGDSYLAAACIDGECGGNDAACARSNKTFCGESSSSSSSSGGSSSGASSSGGSGKTCVAGTYSSCFGNGMTWTGSECCLSGSQTCVDGTYSSCFGTPMSWTGKVCCLAVPVTCVSGTYSSCFGAGMHWTGSLCCME